MATDLYFVRHGETDENVQQIIQGQLIDCPLNERGIAQAERVAQRLADFDFDRIYVSTLRRARQTADAICKHHPDTPVVARPELREMSFGELEGQSYGDGNAPFFEWLYDRWASGIYSDRITGGESLEDVQKRAQRVVGEVVRENAGNAVAIVTHGRWLRILLSSVLEDYTPRRMDELLHRNTAVSHVRYADGAYTVGFLASHDHLEEPAR